MSHNLIALLMFSSMMLLLLTGKRVFGAIGFVAAAAARGWSSNSRRHASPMMPLESSARAITFSDDASALCVTE